MTWRKFRNIVIDVLAWIIVIVIFLLMTGIVLGLGFAVTMATIYIIKFTVIILQQLGG